MTKKIILKQFQKATDIDIEEDQGIKQIKEDFDQ